MSFDATAAAISARNNRLSTFRKHLKHSVFATLMIAATCSGSMAQETFNQSQPSGPLFQTTTGASLSLEYARQSWRDDAEFNGNWGLTAINADAAYAYGYTGKGARIGVIDQPVWRLHPEFAGTDKLTFLTTTGTRTYTDPYLSVKAGDAFAYDGTMYVDGRGDLSDHGTHVAGIAAANRDGKGMQGVAFDARIFAADNGDPGPENGVILGNDGGAYSAAFDAMVDSGVDIITNSWGIGVSGLNWDYSDSWAQYQEIKAILGKPEGGAYSGAIAAARSGVVVEFSAGNDGNAKSPDAMAGLASFVPDIEKYWLSTASVTRDDKAPYGVVISDFSSRCGYTKYFCISAPGTDINSSIFSGSTDGKKSGDLLRDQDLKAEYAEFSGTSMAGPFASGAFAVLKERYPYLKNGEINEILKTTATDLGDIAGC